MHERNNKKYKKWDDHNLQTWEQNLSSHKVNDEAPQAVSDAFLGIVLVPVQICRQLRLALPITETA